MLWGGGTFNPISQQKVIEPLLNVSKAASRGIFIYCSHLQSRSSSVVSQMSENCDKWISFTDPEFML